MSSTRHIVQRPSFTGLGKRPVRTPSHQQDFFTGMIGGVGGYALESPKICGRRIKPVSGSWFIQDAPLMAVVGRRAHPRFFDGGDGRMRDQEKPHAALLPYFMRTLSASGIFANVRRMVSSDTGAPNSSVSFAI